jgi:hypothetical protein
MTRDLRSLKLVAVALVATLFAGCIDQQRQGPATVYTFSWWAMVLPPVGGLALIGLSIWRFRFRRFAAIGGILAGLILTFFVTPLMIGDRVVVDDDHFERTAGLWDRSTQSVRFDEVRSMTLEVQERQGRTGVSKSYTLICAKKDGTEQRVAMGQLLQAAKYQIRAKAQNKNVQLIGFDEE